MKTDDGYAEHIDPLEEWLKANGVDWDRVIGWPQIELDRESGTLKVEQFHLDADGDATIHRGNGGSVYTRLHEYPLVVEPDPLFWEAYTHSRPHAMRHREVQVLAQELRALGSMDGQSVTVVIPATGDSLMFLSPGPVPDADRHIEALERLLPGVRVSVVGGFEMVMHKKADR